MAPTDPTARQDPEPAARAFPPGVLSAAARAELRQALLTLRSGLLRSNNDLANEALKGSGQAFSLDHMADHASDNAEQEISISLLEGETALLEAMEAAIRKIDGQGALPYGLCEACAREESWDPETSAPWIPAGRLRVVPYARLCVAHQEEQEENEPSDR